MKPIAVCLLCSMTALSAPRSITPWEQAILASDEHVRKAEYAAALDDLSHALPLVSNDAKRSGLTLIRMGAVHCDLGDFLAAEKIYLRALGFTSANDDAADKNAIYAGLATAYTQLGDYHNAERYGHLALDLFETAPALQNLASVYHSERKFDEAEALYRRALALVGNGGGRIAASVHSNMARLLRDTGRIESGIQEAALAVKMWEGSLGPDHPQVARGLNNLADLYCAGERWADAESSIERALDMVKRSLGAHSPRLEPVLRTYANVMLHTGRKREAKKMLEAADNIRRQFDRDNLLGYTTDVRTANETGPR